jgi:hypothetical protein
MPADSIPSGADYVRKRIVTFEKELCPHHDKLTPQLRSPTMDRGRYSSHTHTEQCRAITRICGADQTNRDFLLGRLEAMRTYAKADEFALWPKWARNEVRRARGYLLKAAKLVEKYESARKKLDTGIKQRLKQETCGLPLLAGLSENLRTLADSAGLPLRSRRVYVFNEAQKCILANILHRFPQAESRALALLLSFALSSRSFSPQSLKEWRRNHAGFIAARGSRVSLF